MTRSLRIAVLTVAVLVVLVLGTRAYAQATCGRPTNWNATWTGLIWLCPDSPAKASEMNDNLAAIVGYVEAKTGAVGQPLAITGTPVNSANIADGTIASGDLAAASINARELADGGISASKLANRLPVYTLHTQCGDENLLSFAPTCIANVNTAPCGSSCSTFGQVRLTQCDGSCGSCVTAVPIIPCPRNNTFRGFLVGP
jgi:hypothetical protein